MDQGVSVRCVLMWSLFLIAALLGGASLALAQEVGWAAIVASSGGFVLVVLNDNAKTRRLVRAAVREAADSGGRPPLSQVP